jgi:hypothetical protein
VDAPNLRDTFADTGENSVIVTPNGTRANPATASGRPKP